MGTPDNQQAVIYQFQTVDGQERRRWPRILDKEFSKAWFSSSNQGAQSGRVLDIGLGGICLKVMQTGGLKMGQKVVVGLGEWMIPAKVANIIPNEVAGFRLGLEWIRPESAGVKSLVERCCDNPPLHDK